MSADYRPSPNNFAAEQVERYELSGGAEGGTLHGRPVIILTTRGSKTGALRKTPLMRVEHDGRYAVVGSAGGAPKDPAWTRNITADPMVTLQDGPAVGGYRAHLATGDERATWWRYAVEAFPSYADYAVKTDREIPVFVLDPAEQPQPAN